MSFLTELDLFSLSDPRHSRAGLLLFRPCGTSQIASKNDSIKQPVGALTSPNALRRINKSPLRSSKETFAEDFVLDPALATNLSDRHGFSLFLATQTFDLHWRVNLDV